MYTIPIIYSPFVFKRFARKLDCCCRNRFVRIFTLYIIYYVLHVAIRARIWRTISLQSLTAASVRYSKVSGRIHFNVSSYNERTHTFAHRLWSIAPARPKSISSIARQSFELLQDFRATCWWGRNSNTLVLVRGLVGRVRQSDYYIRVLCARLTWWMIYKAIASTWECVINTNI